MAEQPPQPAATSGLDNVRWREGMTDVQYNRAGRLFLREFGGGLGSALFRAGVTFSEAQRFKTLLPETAYKLAVMLGELTEQPLPED